MTEHDRYAEADLGEEEEPVPARLVNDLLGQPVADRARKLSALYDILKIAADPGSLTTTLQRILQRTLKTVSEEAGAIYLLAQSGDSLQLAIGQGLPQNVRSQLSSLPIRPDNAAGWIMDRRQPLVAASAAADPRCHFFTWPEGPAAFIGIPITRHEQSQGLLALFSLSAAPYTSPQEMDLLLAIGKQLGVVIENDRLRRKAEQLTLLEERNRLARELHDSVSQSLYSVTLFAEAGRTLAQQGQWERAGQYFTDVLETGQQALKEMRLLVHKLRPSALEKEGLIRTLRQRLNAVEGRAGVENQFIVADNIQLSQDVEDALYHISQEALNNAIKHSGASRVEVRLHQDESNQAVLIIQDNGRGFHLETAGEGGGLGLTSMRERVALFGGRIAFQTAPGQGTRITVWLPRYATLGKQSEESS